MAIEAIKEKETLSELSKRFGVHSNIIGKRKQEFLKNSSSVFENKAQKPQSEQDNEKAYAKIGRLELENEFLKKSLNRLE